MKLLLIFPLVATVLAATPAVGTPAVFRDTELPAESGAGPLQWKPAEPADALARGEWWRLFGDPVLDELQIRALAENQDLRAGAARVEQARAAAGIARSNYWPQLAVDGSVAREQTSNNVGNPLRDTLTTTYRAPLSVAWELDLFGRVRNLSASARADAEASRAAFETVRLALTAEVAANYFSLRALDRELALLSDSIGLRRRARDLTQSRFASGTATELDVVRFEAELASTEAESAALAQRRASVQHALAVLVGAAAPSFTLAHTTAAPALPAVPAGLPAALLERRPDIAAAERSLAAAHARIGVARAAFFPAISLTGGAGYASGEMDTLFTTDSRIWSIGPRLYLPIFQGGRNRANLERSRAAHEEAVAVFRQQVLVAFREVQDALTARRLLAQQASAQERALAAGRRAATLAQTRYEAGLVSYLEVIDAQRTALATERSSAQLVAQQLNASVALIKALGGGWQRTEPLAAR